MSKLKGYVNVFIHTGTKKAFVSDHPYPTPEEALLDGFWGIGIEKVGCFEIEYSDYYSQF